MGLLQHGEVDMVGHRGAGIVPKHGGERGELVRRRQGENPLPRSLLRELVKANPKGLLKKLGQAGGQVLRLGDDLHLSLVEAVGIEEDAVALCLGAAFPGQGHPAQLRLGVAGKGHIGSSSLVQNILVSARSR